MTDYLPPPPGEIIVEDIVPGQLEYQAQGGSDFKFWNKVSDTHYSQTNVYQYEMIRRSLANKVSQIEQFEEALKEFLSDEFIDSDIAETFADIFDISLKRSFEFTATVEFTFTVELDNDTDVNSVIDNINFEVSDGYNNYELDNSDYNVTYSDYTEV
jgi:hypothetical protein